MKGKLEEAAKRVAAATGDGVPWDQRSVGEKRMFRTQAAGAIIGYHDLDPADLDPADLDPSDFDAADFPEDDPAHTGEDT